MKSPNNAVMDLVGMSTGMWDRLVQLQADLEHAKGDADYLAELLQDQKTLTLRMEKAMNKLGREIDAEREAVAKAFEDCLTSPGQDLENMNLTTRDFMAEYIAEHGDQADSQAGTPPTLDKTPPNVGSIPF